MKIELQAKVREDLSCIIAEKAPTRVPGWKWLPATTDCFHIKTLTLTLTHSKVDVKLGPQHKDHKGWAALRHHANQPACPL